jgi:small subunit ribosomal protein S1
MNNKTSDVSVEELPAMNEDFASLLDESFGEEGIQGSVIKGTIINIDSDAITVDVGLKSEGRIPLKEFGMNVDLNIGDEVDVFVDRYEDRDGLAVLSREKARREEAWKELEKSLEKNERVNGVIFGRVKGGFTVDLDGAVAFLPGSQVDIRPIRDIGPLMGQSQPFQILKMDKARGNIVVSRRAILEEARAEQRKEIITNLKEGQKLEGVVKNITDYGAFIDLGGVDGLLHVTDISWKRITHPSEVLSVGETIDVQIIRFDEANQRISLGIKQLSDDPWKEVEAKYPVGATLKGVVTNITDYGAFVELEDGIEGLVHVSEMSWTKRNFNPEKLVSVSQEVEVKVLDSDIPSRRISLGIKQCQSNPWEEFAATHNVGDVIEGEIKNTTEFGLFIGLSGDIDGMIHLSDLSWEVKGDEALKEYEKGAIVKAKILDISIEKERVSLGIKQLTDDPFASALEGVKKGDVVTCTVTETSDKGVTVDVDGVKGFVRKAELSRDKAERRADRFAEGDKFDAQVISIDNKNRELSLSIKAREIADDKEVMAEYGSTDTGAVLGDILGAALKEAKASGGDDE